MTSRFRWNRAVLLLSLGVISAPAQQAPDVLARLDRFAATFRSAQATVRAITHTAVIDEDETQTGVLTIKKEPGNLRYRIAFSGDNAFTVVVDDHEAQVYHPKIDEIQRYDIRKYRDLAQKMLLLGFGTAGRELAANYDIRELPRETLDSQAVTHLELTPKSPAVLQQLKKVELWISERSQCPVQQKFYFPGGDYRLVTFSGVQVNLVVQSSLFELPKHARRVKMN